MGLRWQLRQMRQKIPMGLRRSRWVQKKRQRPMVYLSSVCFQLRSTRLTIAVLDLLNLFKAPLLVGVTVKTLPEL
jgi:hypothetical protein